MIRIRYHHVEHCTEYKLIRIIRRIEESLNMSDRGGLITLEDQGTLFMFSLLFVMIATAVIYFACVWHNKKKNKQTDRQTDTEKTTAVRPAVAKTFSRFSQVDEELTVHMGSLDDVDDDDDDNGDDKNVDNEAVKSESSQNILNNAAKIDERPPYLETDM